MRELKEMIKIGDIHVDRIRMALKDLNSLLPFDAFKITSLTKENLLLTDFLVHRFGKLQDLLGNKIINEFLIVIDEYAPHLSMLDKIYKLERLEIIKDSEVWKKIRHVRNYVTHDYPHHPDFTAENINKIIELAPQLIEILNNIKLKVGIDL